MSAKPVSPAVSHADHVDALSAGTRLGEFEIVGLLGVGGFGMVYQAFDHSLLRFVAIKEYMPTALAGRANGRSLWVRSSSDEPSYQAGLASFVGEARLLAQFDHASLVKVFRFWEDNHTAYMVMPLYAGMTLKQARTHMRTPPPEIWLRKVIWSVCSALRVLHEAQTLHRDISPDNIFLQDIGPPVLLDLGAARIAISDADRKHTAVLKVNYAPIEQYADSGGDLKSGPWSDLYSLAAVIYGCICNDVPLPSTLRAIRDRMVPFHRVARTVKTQFGVEYSPAFIETLAKALSLQPQDRHTDVDAFLQQLGMTSAPNGLDKFDFRAELGTIWMDSQEQLKGGASASALVVPEVSVPIEKAPVHPVPAPVLVAVSTPVPPPAPLLQSRTEAAPAHEDFQDTVVRDLDFEDTRCEMPQDELDEALNTVPAALTSAAPAPAPVPAASPSGASGIAEASHSKDTDLAAARVVNPSEKSAAVKPHRATVGAAQRKPAASATKSSSSSSSRGLGIMLASAALIVAIGAGAWWWSESASPAKATDPAPSTAYVTPEAEIITERAEPASVAVAASAVASVVAQPAAVAPAATPAFTVASDQKPRLSPVRKPVESPASVAPAPAPAVVAPEPRPAPAASAPAAAKAKSPEDSCANAGFLAKPMCIHNQCQQAGMEKHPICVDNKRRADEERRQRQMYSN